MDSKSLTFDGSLDYTLKARLDLPDNHEPAAFALFAHCFTCNKNLKAVGNINRALTEYGFGVLRFDFTGLGESEGDFSDTNFSSNIEDLIAAASFLEKSYQAPQLLIGHSLGGAAVLQAAGSVQSVEAVATIGAPCEPSHVSRMFEDHRDTIEEQGYAHVTLANRTFTIKKQFLDDLEENNMNRHIRNLDRALMLFHSPVDQVVGVENAAHIFKQAKHPKSFVSLDEADHLLMNQADSQYVGQVTASWADRYLS